MTFDVHENTINTLNSFIRVLNIKVSKYEVSQKIEEHPEPDSILCISDCLKEWNIANAVVKVNKDDIDSLPTPFVTVLKDGDNNFFTVVKDVQEDYITYYSNDKQKYVTTSNLNFLDSWEQIVLIAEPDKNSGEKQYTKNKFRHLITPYCISILAFLLIVFINRFTI